jgi:hypothetical protein
MFLACLAFVLACHDDLPTQARPRRPVSFDLGAPDVPVAGCATLQVALTGGNGITVTPVTTPSCGPIIPVLDSTATYDPVTQTIRLPLALANTWTREVATPARIYAWNDSITITSPTGLVNDSSGNYLRLSNPDSTIGTTTGRFGGARLWRFDTLFATLPAPQLLAPGDTSRGRWIEIHVVSGSPTTFTIVLHAAAQNAHPVASTPPAGEPPGMTDDTNLVRNVPGLGPGLVVKNMLEVAFARTATQAQRQAAIDSVLGSVVGGRPIADNGEGFYIVRIPSDNAGAGLIPALEKLRRLPQVDLAVSIRLGVSPQGLKAHDGVGWQESAYSFVRGDTAGATWALKAINAPLAWGCATGDGAAGAIAIVDKYFVDATAQELNPTYAELHDKWGPG